MNYVFFDVECANCLNGEGKICSFGYVKTDENFQVIKKKDILVNPNAKFLLGNVRTGEGIKLAYPLFKFQRADTFPRYYHEIKSLLEDEDNLCFGFAVHQDVAYLSYSCQRYSLPVIKFHFFDIQKLEQRIYHRKNPSGLDHLVEQFYLPSFTYHRSDDDALMTMEVFQKLLQVNELTMSDALSKYPECISETEYLLKKLKEHKALRAKKKEISEKRTAFFKLDDFKEDLNHYDKYFWKKTFYFHNAVVVNHIDELIEKKEMFRKKGGKETTDILKSDYLVLEDMKDKAKINIDFKANNINVITYDKFIKNLDKGKDVPKHHK